MEQILTELITLIAEKMPELSLVDEDYGQLENIDAAQDGARMYPVTFPCALVEAPETEWSCLADGGQKGSCTVRVRLCVDCYDDTHAGSGTLGKAAERESLRRGLHALVQGFRPGGDGALVRAASRFYTFNHGIKVYETTYRTTVSESVRERVTAAAPRVRVSVTAATDGNR